jgi:2-polyprenyl-6-methoxyphenol hydroxylase-like FAD-dependent oxidoreductase
MRRTAALIIGGGPAGCAAALTLMRGGVRAELIERTAGEHDVVCGGFIGWDALRSSSSSGSMSPRWALARSRGFG